MILARLPRYVPPGLPSALAVPAPAVWRRWVHGADAPHGPKAPQVLPHSAAAETRPRRDLLWRQTATRFSQHGQDPVAILRRRALKVRILSRLGSHRRPRRPLSHSPRNPLPARASQPPRRRYPPSPRAGGIPRARTRPRRCLPPAPTPRSVTARRLHLDRSQSPTHHRPRPREPFG